MKTLLVLILVFSFSASFASENMASDCNKTLHSEDRENTKESLNEQPATRESGQGAMSL
jgi:hypothetical protein